MMQMMMIRNIFIFYCVGILARDFTHKHDEMVYTMSKWIKTGQMKYKETIVHGFDNLPSALHGLFEGKNIGKCVVKV